MLEKILTCDLNMGCNVLKIAKRSAYKLCFSSGEGFNFKHLINMPLINSDVHIL